jgi:hypothetical protein
MQVWGGFRKTVVVNTAGVRFVNEKNRIKQVAALGLEPSTFRMQSEALSVGPQRSVKRTPKHLCLINFQLGF